MARRALVLADFTGETTEEISAPKGEFITVFVVEDDGWCDVEYNGKRGIFPSNYLSFDVIESTEEKPAEENMESVQPEEPISDNDEKSQSSDETAEENETEGEGEDDTEVENTVEAETEEENHEETEEERAIRKEAQRVKQRKNIINEIRDTESDYVKDLQIIVSVFNAPLSASNIISQQDINGLFSNIAVLLNVNQKLNDEISACEDDETILVGKIFVGMADFFKMYTAYCANQPKAMEVLDRLGRNSAFKNFTDQCMLNPDCRGLTLFSFLIKPIQRICKYPLLLKDLLRNTPEDHPDHENLVTALSKIEEVVAYVNERKRLAENLQKILDIGKQIESNEELSLVSPSRRFVREGTFTVLEKTGRKDRTIYLFNDLVVITKPKRNANSKDHFKYQLSLNEAKIIDVADTDETQNACEIRPKESEGNKEAYTIIFPNPEDKKAWVREIKALVKEFQRKQLQEQQRLASLEAAGEATAPEEDKKDKKKSRREKKTAPLAPSKASGTRKNTGSIVGSPFGSWRKSASKKDLTRLAEGSPKEKTRSKSKKEEKALKKEISKSLGAKQQPPPKKTNKAKPVNSKTRADTAPAVQVGDPNFTAQLAAKLAARNK